MAKNKTGQFRYALQTTLLYEALASPLGLLLSCSEPIKAAEQLRFARRLAADPSLDCLMIRQSPWPDQGQLVVVKIARPGPGPGSVPSPSPSGSPGPGPMLSARTSNRTER
jgi:hypothetical protein